MIRTLILLLSLILPVSADQNAAVHAAVEAQLSCDRGDYARAVELFTTAIKEDETNPSFYVGRGNVYSKLNRLDDALKNFDTGTRKAIAFTGDPQDKRLAYFLYNRACAYDHAGRIKEALAEYEKAIQLDPSYPDAHCNVAWILATCSDPTVQDAKKALEYALLEARRTEGDPPARRAAVLDTLAAAYAANGQFEDARNSQKQAISQIESPEDKRKFSERLGLYEQNKPYVARAE